MYISVKALHETAIYFQVHKQDFVCVSGSLLVSYAFDVVCHFPSTSFYHSDICIHSQKLIPSNTTTTRCLNKKKDLLRDPFLLFFISLYHDCPLPQMLVECFVVVSMTLRFVWLFYTILSTFSPFLLADKIYWIL